MEIDGNYEIPIYAIKNAIRGNQTLYLVDIGIRYYLDASYQLEMPFLIESIT